MDPFLLVGLLVMNGHQLVWSSALLLRCLPLGWFVVVGLQQFCFSYEEYLFYDMYSVSLILSTPIVRCTHMRFHRAFWRRFLYPGDLALYCLTLLLYVHTSCVSINICCKSLIRACEVAPVLIQLLPGECGCCGCLLPPPYCLVYLNMNQQLSGSRPIWEKLTSGYHNYQLKGPNLRYMYCSQKQFSE